MKNRLEDGQLQLAPIGQRRLHPPEAPDPAHEQAEEDTAKGINTLEETKSNRSKKVLPAICTPGKRAVGERTGRSDRPPSTSRLIRSPPSAHVETLGEHRDRHFQNGEHGPVAAMAGEHEEEHHEEVTERHAGKHRRKWR